MNYQSIMRVKSNLYTHASEFFLLKHGGKLRFVEAKRQISQKYFLEQKCI